MIFNPFKLAKDIFFNNKRNGVTANNVQGAIEEINTKFGGLVLTPPITQSEYEDLGTHPANTVYFIKA